MRTRDRQPRLLDVGVVGRAERGDEPIRRRRLDVQRGQRYRAGDVDPDGQQGARPQFVQPARRAQPPGRTVLAPVVDDVLPVPGQPVPPETRQVGAVQNAGPVLLVGQPVGEHDAVEHRGNVHQAVRREHRQRPVDQFLLDMIEEPFGELVIGQAQPRDDRSCDLLRCDRLLLADDIDEGPFDLVRRRQRQALECLPVGALIELTALERRRHVRPEGEHQLVQDITSHQPEALQPQRGLPDLGRVVLVDLSRHDVAQRSASSAGVVILETRVIPSRCQEGGFASVHRIELHRREMLRPR